ncbi:MAG: hypothetical protein Q8N69_03510, partial [bacterium]|nr:hypothetical protein [bacterium]
YFFNRVENVADQDQKFRQLLEQSLADNPLITANDFSSIEIYTAGITKNQGSALFLATLSEEKIKSIYGIKNADIWIDAGELNLFIEAMGKVAIQADYIKENNEWKLKEDPKIYQATDLKTMTEQLVGAQGKSDDVSIKADLSILRATAELYASDNNNSYLNFYASYDAKAAENEVNQYSKLIWGVNKKDSWVACAKLVTNNNYYCVDGTGISKETSIPCNPNSIVCP